MYVSRRRRGLGDDGTSSVWSEIPLGDTGFWNAILSAPTMGLFNPAQVFQIDQAAGKAAVTAAAGEAADMVTAAPGLSLTLIAAAAVAGYFGLKFVLGR